MNLYVFLPHKDWTYMGGARVVIAESFDESVKLIKEWVKQNDAGGYGEDSHTELSDENGTSEYSDWVLEYSCPVNEKKARFVAESYNYA